MKEMQARDSTTRAIDLITKINRDKIEICLLSADAEKAFDRVNWTFMMHTLKEIGLGVMMKNWIKSIYTFPRAQVTVNGVFPKFFLYKQRDKAGYPLSPLLVIIS